jgi:flagellar hook-associated protein 3 FlgL
MTMNFQTIGDLAQSFALRRQGVDLRQQLDRLGLELSSGRAADLGRHLSGNLLPLADIEHELVLLAGHRAAAREAATDTEVMQAALARVQGVTTDLATQAIILGTAGTTRQVSDLAATATQALGSLIGSLNTEVAGRALFSGAQTDTSPLAAAETVLSEVRGALIGATTAAEVKSRLDVFFDSPTGGFLASIYQGGDSKVAPYRLGSGESVALDIRADNAGLRAALKQIALIAVSDDAGLALAFGDRISLASGAGVALLAHQDVLTELRASLGQAENRIAQSAVRIAAEITSFEIARGELVSVDAFETAVELEQVQFQLESLYTVTARASRLSLLNFLS